MINKDQIPVLLVGHFILAHCPFIKYFL